MNDDEKELVQEYHSDGSLKSHKEIKRSSYLNSSHAEIVNVSISVMLALTAVFGCSMILIGAMSVILDRLPSIEVKTK